MTRDQWVDILYFLMKIMVDILYFLVKIIQETKYRINIYVELEHRGLALTTLEVLIITYLLKKLQILMLRLPVFTMIIRVLEVLQVISSIIWRQSTLA